MNYFEYNGVKSSDMGLRIKSKNVYSSPKFDSQFVSVPGRNGDLIVSNNRYENIPIIWQCNRKFKNNTCCKTPHITEDEIKARFLKVYNGLISDKELFIKACKLARDVLTDTKEIDREISALLRELEVVTELIKKCIAENSSSAQDQEEYTERYNSYVDRYEKAKSRNILQFNHMYVILFIQNERFE